MLEKQEADRMREIKAREERQQMFMNRMADTVIKEMDNKAHEEEMKIRKWELERELAERKAEEQRLKRKKDGNESCRRHLFLQMEERKKREKEEHERNQEQAHIWAKDREHMLVHEKQVNEKIKKHNHDTAEFLRTQMQEKTEVVKNRLVFGKMNRNEILYNMNMLKTVNDKLRAASGERDSEGGVASVKGSVPPNSAAAPLSHR